MKSPTNFIMSYKREPVMQVMCATCPFRPDSPIANIAGDLALSALRDSSRICHSTGGNNLVIPKSKNYHKDSRLCRGARDVQLAAFFAMKVITAPTDEAWEAKCREMGHP